MGIIRGPKTNQSQRSDSVMCYTLTNQSVVIFVISTLFFGTLLLCYGYNIKALLNYFILACEISYTHVNTHTHTRTFAHTTHTHT